MRVERIALTRGQVRKSPCVLAVGVFDGVHLGHQRLLARAVEHAWRLGLPAAALTFDPSPATVLGEGGAPLQLTGLSEKVALMRGLGLGVLYVMRFDGALARVAPEEFVARVLSGMLRARLVVVGSTHTFGAGGRGKVATLRAAGGALGFEVEVVERVALDGRLVTSTAIRRMLGAAEVRQAARALGRPYRVSGAVVAGEGRGRTLGFPTLNLSCPAERLLPARGIYACRAWWGGEARPAAVYIGARPTFSDDGAKVVVEAHVLGGQVRRPPRTVSLDFIERLRGDRKWPRAAGLVGQMRRDVEQAARVLAAGADRPVVRGAGAAAGSG
jgi:riboflavin kinase/FMN adenylyltransferase